MRAVSIAASCRLTDSDPGSLRSGWVVGEARYVRVVKRLQRRQLRWNSREYQSPRARGTPPSPWPPPLSPSDLRRLHEVRPVATVDRVDRVIDRPVHHRKVQHRHRRRLPGSHDDRVRRNQVPVGHRVRARDCGRRERDERDCDEKWQN